MLPSSFASSRSNLSSAKSAEASLFASSKSNATSFALAEDLPSRNAFVATVGEALSSERAVAGAAFQHILEQMEARHSTMLGSLASLVPHLPEEASLMASDPTGIKMKLPSPSKPVFIESDRISAVVVDHVPKAFEKLGDAGGKFQSEPSAGQQASEDTSEHILQQEAAVIAARDSGSKSVRKITTRNSASNYADERAKVKGLGVVCFLLRRIIHSAKFEVVLAGLIVLNACTMAMEAQYLSFDTAHKLGWHDANSPASDMWPGAELGFHIVEFFFGIVFTLEVLCKLLVGARVFCSSAWNWFDTLIVGFWILSLFDIRLMLGNPMLLRLMRLVRLLRLVRLVKTIQLFDVLHLLLHSLKASGTVLLWAIVLLLVAMLAFALVFNFLLEPYILDTSEPIKNREDVFRFFGSFSRAFVTMFQMTLGNWGPPTRIIIEHVSEWYAPFLVGYVCVMNFAVIQVIRSVFIHETFSVASMDCDIMIMQQEQKIQKHASNMELLFAEADESGDGFITFDEFESICEDPRVKAWLAAMDFEITDARLVFELIDDGDQKLSATELAQGVRRLKGTARSIDMISLQNVCRRIERYLLCIATGKDFQMKKGASRLTAGS